MTGIQASQAIEEYTLTFSIPSEEFFPLVPRGGVATLPSGKKVLIDKGTVLIVRTVKATEHGIEVAVISQDHLHAIASGLLAD
jgi:hypothetical protein